MPISHPLSARLALPVSQPCRQWLRSAVHCSYALCSRFNALHESREDHRVTVFTSKQGAHLHPFCLWEHFLKGLFLLFDLQQCSRWQPDQHLHHHRARTSSERGHLGKKNHWVCCHCVLTRSLRLWASLPVEQLSNCREFPQFFVFSSSNQILLLPLYNANVSRGCLLLRIVIAKARP